MAGFLGKLFGKKKQESGPEAMVDQVLDGLFSLCKFELGYDLKTLEDGTIHVDIFGEDEGLLTEKEAQLLDAIQLYVRRSVQHQVDGEPFNINLDCANYRQQANEALIELADKLKDIALTKGKPVYFRALAPKDRKTVHQYLAEDGRVKSRSVGEGHFKKIKIYATKASDTVGEESNGATDPR